MKIATVAKKILDIIFPPQCLVCNIKMGGGEKFSSICENCFASIEVKSGFLCPVCGRRLHRLKPAPGSRFCHPEAKFILAAAADFSNPALRELIYALKYKQIKTAAEPLAVILFLYLEKILTQADCDFENFITIPLPLYPARERKRGYNQSLILAEALSKKISLQIRAELMQKIKNTCSQTEVQDRKKREENVAGSFIVKDPSGVRGKNILLIDDVFTSGATLKEAALVLKSAGAKKIIGLVVAKA